VERVVAGHVRALGLTVAVLAGATVLGYLAMIAAESGPNEWVRVALVAATIAGAAVAAWIGSVATGPRLRSAALAAAAGVLLALGYLALFSIGLVLVFIGLLATGAAIAEARAVRATGPATLGFVAGAAVALVPLFISG
jgi:hypothetical protein